ncbi:2408_t:CDS:2, partial [Ambispora gerdemannii]
GSQKITAIDLSWKRIFDERQKGEISMQKKLGYTNNEISLVLVLLYYEYGKHTSPKERTGRPRIFNTFARKQLKLSVVQNKNTRHQTLSQIRLNYKQTISTQTIHNELAKEEAVAHEYWTVEDFKKSFGQMKLLTHSFKLRVLDVPQVFTLERWVKEKWDAVPESYYRDLIESMPRRIQAVIAANGVTHNFTMITTLELQVKILGMKFKILDIDTLSKA